MSNRHSRRAAAAKARKRNRILQHYNTLYNEYIRHLPSVPVDTPFEPGEVHHLVIHHDDWCRFYDTENMNDCNCNPILSRHVEPQRS